VTRGRGIHDTFEGYSVTKVYLKCRELWWGYALSNSNQSAYHFGRLYNQLLWSIQQMWLTQDLNYREFATDCLAQITCAIKSTALPRPAHMTLASLLQSLVELPRTPELVDEFWETDDQFLESTLTHAEHFALQLESTVTATDDRIARFLAKSLDLQSLFLFELGREVDSWLRETNPYNHSFYIGEPVRFIPRVRTLGQTGSLCRASRSPVGVNGPLPNRNDEQYYNWRQTVERIAALQEICSLVFIEQQEEEEPYGIALVCERCKRDVLTDFGLGSVPVVEGAVA